ncbi:uncharacterized protein F5Z01DRAFT_750249 [Emericellopsis atlantica]|uniref:Uncharacterized protein n=1 Tax=Emericellopsis atlantica TaxID=2614577 RepID=A0A9P7ZMB5_9HYPO|nr:uncharacterized protein F5Z01DRAFT_750249 [Emericellopsis atlantica]KAG9254342.1 hypothetical protein F5Z01DRAFT_750249 [Emericellopsis atlantica]
MTIPSLPFTFGDFFRYPKHSQPAVHDYLRIPTLECITELHAIIRTGTFQQIERALERAGVSPRASSLAVLFMAIEPTTGNSLMHTAVIAQRIDVMDYLRAFRSHRPAAYRPPHYALWSHQNHDGNTMLHSAVQSGQKELVVAVFQIFRDGNIDELDELLRSEEADDWGFDNDNEEEFHLRLGELVLLLRENAKGRSAADEAQALGHTDIATWLERTTQLDDPLRERNDPSIVQIWREICDDHYAFLDEGAQDVAPPLTTWGSGMAYS